ncbi:MAG: porin, partial [Burkholderiales bacterium]
DFAASKGSAAEAQLRERLKSAIRTIPATDTQYLIGGYVQLDGLVTRKKQDGDEQDTFIASTIPFGPADADYRLSVRQSQINWLSRTPTSLGPVWTRLEANLFPLDGKTAPTLNQLFVRLDDWVIVGKTYSTFMDDGILPTTLDYNGPSGVTFVRQWLARGSIPFGSGWALEASVEESQADLDAGGASISVHADARRPDLAARVRYEGDFGHLQLAGLSRSIKVTAESPLGTRNWNVNGTGVSLSGSLNTFGDDTLLWQAVTGKGVGRYFNDPLSATGVALGSDWRFELVRSSGATLYYQHKWAPDWMTVAGVSTLWVSDEGLRPPDALRRVVYASANLLHRLTPTLIVGGEALWGEATQVGGASATNVRVQISLRYLIF